jgi:signal transduction histidine kinase
MADEQLKQLFTPFFTTKPSGSGLGLVLSQRVIALHGGRLWAERGGVGAAARPKEPVRGMTFRVTLPATGRDESQGS